MANKPKFTKSVILRAIRGDISLPDPILPKIMTDKGEATKVVDEIAAAFFDNPQLSSHGHIPTIAARLLCSEQTVRNYVNRRNKEGKFTKTAIAIQEAIEHEKNVVYSTACDEIRHEIKTDAQKMLHLLIKAGDGASVRFGLERLDKDNYASRTEVASISLLDDDALKALGEMAELLDSDGKNPSEEFMNALHKYKAKRIAHKDKGKNNTHSKEPGESDA